MERFKALEVYFDTQKVGTLATYQNRITAFEYAPAPSASRRTVPLRERRMRSMPKTSLRISGAPAILSQA